MMIMVMHCLVFHPCSIIDRVRQYLDIWHNNTTHIFSDAARGNLTERETLLTWKCLLLFFVYENNVVSQNSYRYQKYNISFN